MAKTTIRLQFDVVLHVYLTAMKVNAATAKEALIKYVEQAVADDAADLNIEQQTVLTAVRNNCVYDKKSRLQSSFNAGQYVPNRKERNELVTILGEYCDKLLPKKGTGKGHTATITSSNSLWKTSREEIEKIADGDITKLKSLYDAMATAKSRYPEAIEADMGMDEFEARRKLVSAKYSAAKKAASVGINEDLLAKLKAGKKQYTADEVAAMLKLLNK